MWNVEITDQFKSWFGDLDADEQDSVAFVVRLLEEHGPALKFPYSSGIVSARTCDLRELRVQHEGDPYRVLYAFDPRRSAILLLGGGKTGDDRWYERNVPRAEKLYEECPNDLRKGG